MRGAARDPARARRADSVIAVLAGEDRELDQLALVDEAAPGDAVGGEADLLAEADAAGAVGDRRVGASRAKPRAVESSTPRRRSSLAAARASSA